jgi:hypothetical protein
VLEPRISHLIRCQNADGGWGYFPGKDSWLEPTVYAMRAISCQPGGPERAARGFALIERWQNQSGAWSPKGNAVEEHWTTSLVLNLAPDFPLSAERRKRAIEWILKTEGQEGGWFYRTVSRFRPQLVEQDDTLHGWPWRAGNSSWVEPTSHTLLALKRVRKAGGADSRAPERIQMGESFLWDRRCPDGGWNYGNRRVYRTNMPSFPETTGLALLALQDSKRDLTASLDAARRHLESRKGRLGQAWLAIGLACHSSGQPPATAWEPRPALAAGGDILITALEAIAMQPAAVARFKL